MFGKSDTWRSGTAAVHRRASGKKYHNQISKALNTLHYGKESSLGRIQAGTESACGVGRAGNCPEQQNTLGENGHFCIRTQAWPAVTAKSLGGYEAAPHRNMFSTHQDRSNTRSLLVQPSMPLPLFHPHFSWKQQPNPNFLPSFPTHHSIKTLKNLELA